MNYQRPSSRKRWRKPQGPIFVACSLFLA